MRTVKKKIKMPIGVKDADLSNMLNGMLGVGAVNVGIAYPRYLRIRNTVDNLLRVIEVFNTSIFMKTYKEFSQQRAEIDAFTRTNREAFARLFTIDFTDYEWNLDLLDETQRSEFSSVYENVKKADMLKIFIIMCDRLVTYKRYIGDKDNLSGRFILTMPGADFIPLPFTTLNIKYIFSMAGISDITKEFILNVLHKLYYFSHMLYDELTSPDIDIDEVINVIMTNMKEIQRRPELSRCKDAFNKLIESINLLKTNFNGYYRDFVSTKSSTIIMEHFVMDVANNIDARPHVRRQFMTIIKYYQQQAQLQKNNSDPRIKVLFDKVNESFKALEKDTENLRAQEDDPLPDREDEEETAPADVAADDRDIDELVALIEGKK